MRKFHITTTAELVRFALDHGIADDPASASIEDVRVTPRQEEAR